MTTSDYQANGQQNSVKQANASSTFNVWHVLNSARRWWKIATPLGMVLAGAAAAAVWFTYEPVYEASSWMRIQDRSPYIAFQNKDDSRRFVQNQIELLKSPLVLGSVVSSPTVASTPELVGKEDQINALSSKLKIKSVGQSEMFRIIFRSTNPKKAAEVVNEVAQSYFNLQNQNDAERTERVIQLLDSEKKSRELELKGLRDVVRAESINSTGRDPYELGSSIARTVSPFSALKIRLFDSEVEQLVLQVQLMALEESNANKDLKPTPSQVEQVVEQHPEVLGLRARIAANQATAREYEARAVEVEKNTKYQQLKKAIADDEEALKKLRSNFQTTSEEDMKTFLLAQQQNELAIMKAKVDTNVLLIAKLKEMLGSEIQEGKKYTGDTFDLEIKQGELAEATELYNRIKSRITQIRTEQRAPSRVELLQQASVPSIPIERIPYKQLMLAILAGLMAPFALAVGWETLIQRVSDKEQLEKSSQLSVIGEIACLPTRRTMFRSNHSPSVTTSLRLYEESIDSLRTSLMLPEHAVQMQVIAVTSARSREGKTSVAAQLAVSIGRATGENVLLVDGDMRAPDTHTVFDIPKGPGLADVLQNDSTLEEAINKDWSATVHLLPAGNLETSPHKLLGNGVFKKVLESIRRDYRYIVLDTPPILAASEALVMAKQADATIVCTMRDVSRISQVQSALDRLVSVGAKPIGTVLNGVPTSYYSYHYGKYGYDQS